MGSGWYDTPMEAVVDQAGRIVLPKFIRDALGLLPGTKVDISPYGAGVQVVPAGRTARLVEEDGVLVSAGDTPVDAEPPLRWFGDAAEYFEKCALARAVAADDAEHLALVDFEGNILQGPKVLRLGVDGATSRVRAAVSRFLKFPIESAKGRGQLVCDDFAKRHVTPRPPLVLEVVKLADFLN